MGGGGSRKARESPSTQVWGTCGLICGFAFETGACERLSVVSRSSAGPGLRGGMPVSRLFSVGAVGSTCAVGGFTVCVGMLFAGYIWPCWVDLWHCLCCPWCE